MSQNITVNGFRWDKIFKFTEDFIKKSNDSSDIGFF